MKQDWWSCDGQGSTERPPEGRKIGRRRVLSALGLGALWWSTGKSALAQLAVRSEGDPEGATLVVLFLRGGADGLNMVVPYGDDDYHRARPTLRIAAPSDRSREDRAVDLDGFFGLHPALAPLAPVFQEGELAFVHAVGSHDETRSHFEAMNAMERGLPEQTEGVASGWLARHLSSTERGKASPLRAVAFSSTMPDSLRGAPQALALQSLEEFRIDAEPQRAAEMRRALAELYRSPADVLSEAGRETLKVLDSLNRLDPRGYIPSGGALYPRTPVGRGLRQTAFLIKSGLGLEVACLDMGGWDTHVAQGAGTGWQAGLLRELAEGLAAFRRDLGPRAKRVTVVVQTEFGRRVRENTGLGTDHGHASVMFLMGGGVRGGKVHGRWPGLADHQLTGPGDLVATTDYRNVLAEVLAKRLGNPDSAFVFPGLRPAFPGVVG